MPTYKSILRIAIQSTLRHCFDYLPPEDCDKKSLTPGVRVKVPFGKRETVGILMETATKTAIDPKKLKPAIAILDEKPLWSKKLMQLITWTSDYYHHPIGDVMLNALPKLLRQGKTAELKKYVADITEVKDKPIKLNSEQQQAVNAINKQQKFGVFLLDGVTGSGKTEVYLQAIAKIIQQGKQALILVPEIGLTPQTVARFQQRFDVQIAVLHSKLTDRERLNAWMLAKEGSAKIIIGTRSAIFTPMTNLAIIIIDEEHDMSFKQQSGLRYSARDLAIVRAKSENISIVLGSATPSLESIYNVARGRYIKLHLPERAGDAKQPDFYLIDMRHQPANNGLSPQLLQHIQQHLEQDGQVLLFLNRRGYAPTLLCHNCGWNAVCERCDARLTLHQQPKYLHCHHCNATKPVYKICPKCNSDQMVALGLGTERIEETLQEIFPTTPLIRIDKDSTSRKGSMEQMLTAIHDNNCQILIGTQMLAKGHHFPNLTMVAVLNIDGGLLSSDFRASEQISQLIMQVAGRAGRAEKAGTVYIQTYNPNHPLLQRLIKQGYQAFADGNLIERQAAFMPPFSHFALIRAEAKDKTAALEFLTQLKKLQLTNINLLGPIPAPMQRKAGLYRAQLLINSKHRSHLHQALDILMQKIDTLKTSHLKWSLDVDPLDMN